MKFFSNLFCSQLIRPRGLTGYPFLVGPVQLKTRERRLALARPISALALPGSTPLCYIARPILGERNAIALSYRNGNNSSRAASLAILVASAFIVSVDGGHRLRH